MTPELINLLQQAIQSMQNGDLLTAEAHASQALKGYPDNFDAMNVLGSIKGLLGKSLESIELLSRAEKLKGNDFGLQFNLAKAYMDAGKFLESVPHHRKAISINANNPDLYINYAKSLNELGDYSGAIESYDKALKLSPNDQEILTFKGLVLNRLEENTGAIEVFDTALSIDPGYVPALFSKGVVYYDLRDYEKAIFFYEAALKIDSDDPAIWFNKGLAHHDCGQYPEALSSYLQAKQRRSDYPEVEFSEALTRLTLGDLKLGLQKFEARWKKADAPMYHHSHIEPLTTPKDLSGKTVLVWEEEGFGDAIQFSRYIILLLKTGAKVIFEVRPELVDLFQCLKGVSFILKGDKVDAVDYQVPLQTLPLIFNASISNIPSCDRYLSVRDSLVNEWSAKLNLHKGKFNIGVATAINSKYANFPGHKRAMPLKTLAPLLEMANLFVVQKEIPKEDVEFIHQNTGITYLGDEISDFSDTAAIIKNMDLIVCVDTSLAHIAGALGQKTFVLLSKTADWRWFLNTNKSPWYSSVTLFRQNRLGDWSEVVERVKQSLL